jgi:hypothetical protein
MGCSNTRTLNKLKIKCGGEFRAGKKEILMPVKKHY